MANLRAKNKDIKVELEQAEDIFLLLEKLNAFFHQPDNFSTKEQFDEFAQSIYPEISTAYYETVWSWLPKQTQRKYEER